MIESTITQKPEFAKNSASEARQTSTQRASLESAVFEISPPRGFRRSYGMIELAEPRRLDAVHLRFPGPSFIRRTRRLRPPRKRINRDGRGPHQGGYIYPVENAEWRNGPFDERDAFNSPRFCARDACQRRFFIFGINPRRPPRCPAPESLLERVVRDPSGCHGNPRRLRDQFRKRCPSLSNLE